MCTSTQKRPKKTKLRKVKLKLKYWMAVTLYDWTTATFSEEKKRK